MKEIVCAVRSTAPGAIRLKNHKSDYAHMPQDCTQTSHTESHSETHLSSCQGMMILQGAACQSWPVL